MTVDEIIRSLPALGGAGGMLLIAKFVYSITTGELDRMTARAVIAEKERDEAQALASLYARSLIEHGIAIPAYNE